MQEILPLRKFIQEVGTQLNIYFASPTIMQSTVSENNNDALGLAKSPSKIPSTRHIDVKYHFFREHVGYGKGIMIQRVESKQQKADVFNKGSPEEKIQYIRKLLAGW